MPASDLIALVDKIVRDKSDRKVDMERCLDLNELVRMRTGNARPVVSAILAYVNGFDDRRAFFALNLLETLMLNGGFPVRFLVSRKESLNELVKRFPAAPKRKADRVEEYILLLLSKWAKSLGERSVRREEYSNFVLMADLLRSKGFLLPVVPQDELNGMLSDEVTPKLTPKEDLMAEDRLILETDDRGWKEQVINNALSSQLSELQDQLETLHLLSGEGKEHVVSDIKAAAPRLVRLARSESMPSDLLEKVLALHDGVNLILGTTTNSNPAPSDKEDDDEITNNHNNGAKIVCHEKVYCDLIHIKNKRYFRILNHSDKIIHNIYIKVDSLIMQSIDFIPIDETITIKLPDSAVCVSVLVDRDEIIIDKM